MKSLKLEDLKLISRGKKAGGEELRYICPFCTERKRSPDTKGHLYVNLTLRVYHCFRCDASLKTTGVALFSFTITSRIFSKPKEITSSGVSLPLDYCPLSKSTEDFFPIFKGYAKSRNIRKEDALKYSVGFTTDLDSPFFGRLIFCYFGEGDTLLFYQGRWVANSDHPCKYLSCGEKPLFKSFRGSVKVGLIVEGVFDMIAASRFIPSAALLGSSVSEVQRKQIEGSFTDRVILALDSDGSSEIMRCLRKIKKPLVTPIFLPKKDISDMGEKRIESLIREIL